MTVLTPTELSELDAIQDVAIGDFTSQDAVDYYTFLQGKGFDYGALALGVVQNNTARGVVANGFAGSAAAAQGKNFEVGSADWTTMQYHLMQQDFSRRLANSGADLSLEQYDNIHGFALGQVGLTPDVWTAHTPLMKMMEFNPTLATGVWTDLTTDTGFFDGWFTEGLTLGFNAGVAADQTLPEIAADYADLMKWHGHMAIALAKASPTIVEELLPEASFPQLWADMEDFQGFLDGTFDLDDPFLAPWLADFPGSLDPEHALPGFIPDALSPWNSAPTQASPITIDIDGDGVELTTFSASTTETFFDIDGDGFAEQTAWVDGDDGLLARDLDESGTIDSVEELFGSPGVDGFSLLALLDDICGTTRQARAFSDV